ncbi:MAG: Asp-tRNA(Asn)/Glu-tRNA(Gln) amidotransferase GatCAB subunit B, partial [Cyanobacteria bacterium J06553_1]
EPIYQETRLWEEGPQRTKSMRMKEGSSDYRYFPEPDLPPIEVSADQLKAWQGEMPELPAQKRHRYQEELGLSAYDTGVIADDRATAEFFESAISTGASAKLVTNWLMSDIAGYLNAEKLGITDTKLTPEALAEMVKLIEDGTISNKIGKDLLPDLLKSGGSPKKIVESKGLSQISDPAEIESMIDDVLAANPDELAKFRAGKTKLKGFFVGQVMKKTGGRADPKLTNQLLSKKLAE